MNRFMASVCKAAALVVLLAVGPVASAQEPVITAPANDPIDVRGGWASDRVMVRLSPDAVSCTLSHTANGNTHTHTATLSPTLNQTCARWGVTTLEPAYPFEFGDHALASSLGLDRYFIMHVPKGTDTKSLANTLASDTSVIQQVELEPVGGIAALLPNDTDFDLQYGLNNDGVGTVQGQPKTLDADIDAPEAWQLHTGDLGTVTIAIIDSGIYPHPEFASRMVPGINMRAGDPANLTTDETNSGHGTHVSGIATAKGNNGTGVAGVTWGAYLMPVRVTDAGGVGFAGEAAAGIIWAVDHGADVCNMSLQYCAPSADGLTFLQNAVDYANARGVVIVAAAGNSNLCGVDTLAFPARLPGTIAVAATDSRDIRWAGSNKGLELDVAAPGRSIWSTSNASFAAPFHYLTGTSMATPQVTGLVALLKSFAPYMTNTEVRDTIFATVDDLGPVGWDNQYGLGRINAFGALSAARAPIDIIESNPPHLAIDARQPFNIDGSNPTGWDSVDMTFTDSPAGLRPKDFTIETKPAGQAPVVTSVTVVGNTLTLQFDSPIPLVSWTTITYVHTGAFIQLARLPGDVSANGLTNVDDIITLVDFLNNVGPSREIWSTDLDRSGITRPSDLVRLIDLLNGADAFDPYNEIRLPTLP